MASYGVLDMKYPILKRKYHYINSNFGNRSYYNSAGRKVSDFHKGIDCQSNSSDHTDYVLAPWPGKVIGYCNTMSGTTTDTGTAGMGNYLKVDLGNGWTMSFQHMKKGSVKFKTGDKVTQGAEVGYMGLTGNTSGYHLHFDLFVKGDQTAKYGGRYFSSLGRTYVDPKPYLAGTLALPWNESSAPSTGNYVVTADVNVRKGAGAGYAKLTFKKVICLFIDNIFCHYEQTCLYEIYNIFINHISKYVNDNLKKIYFKDEHRNQMFCGCNIVLAR